MNAAGMAMLVVRRCGFNPPGEATYVRRAVAKGALERIRELHQAGGKVAGNEAMYR